MVNNIDGMEDVWKRVPVLLAELYKIIDQFEGLFPGRKFTPDGHLVGSIGEVIAAYLYDLTLLPSSSKNHDAKTKDGRSVQIKFTGGASGFSIYESPDYLIALQLIDRKKVVEVYNGPGQRAWACAGKKQKNGQCPMSIASLKTAMMQVPDEDRIQRIRELQF